MNCDHKFSANNDIPTLNYHKEVPQLWGVTAATALFMLRNIRDARGCQEPFLTSFTTKMALILSDKNISGCFVFFVDCEPAAFFISVLFRADGRVEAFHGGSALVTTAAAAAAGDSLRTTSYGLNIKSNS